MRTTINKHKPRTWERVVNDDGMVWTTEMPGVSNKELSKKKYKAAIPDSRLDHCSFEYFGYHLAWADTIEELVEDIKSFGVTYYSEAEFLDCLVEADKNNKVDDREVELYWDGRRTKVTRGEFNLNNMTAYTSF